MRFGQRVSIKDIAKEAGVSYSTVSRALNNSQLISVEVRERVQAIAREMGYTPNALAQSLQSRLTHSIGLVITTISDPFFMEVVKGVEEVAQEAGISVFLATSNNDPEQEIRIIETFNRRRVDGVIVAASRIGSDYASRLEQIQIPVIMVNNQAIGEYRNLFSVSVDDYAGARMAVNHLLDLGHRRIGYIGVNNRPASNERRLRGYLETLAKAGLSFHPEWVLINDTVQHEDLTGDLRVGENLMPLLWQTGITAAFCYCDTVAAGAMLVCRRRAIEVPQQVSIVGFDDNDLCQLITPRLTTVHQPKREMGQIAMQMLLISMKGRSVDDCILQPSLMIRESSAPPMSDKVPSY